MKRILASCLLLLLLLSACGERVPVYEQPETSVPSDSTLPKETEPPVQTPELSQPDAPHTVPKDDTMLRLENKIFATCDGVYYADAQLLRYNEEKDRMEICCTQENCPHTDESCSAWSGDTNGLRFAVREDKAFVLWGERDTYGQYLTLEFYSMDLAEGQRRSYYSIAAEAGQMILPGDMLICGNTALLSYAVGREDAKGSKTKTQYILAFDLEEGTVTTVLTHEMDFGSTYDLWGMNESHLILAFHHGGGIQSYGDYVADGVPNYDYDEYARDMGRWVLLEYPIEENAKWSVQVAAHEAGTELKLFSYQSFYEGKLYYLANSYLKVYDLSTHKNEVLFYLPGVAHLFCADGKVFYRTDAKEFFYYDLTTEQAYQYQKDSLREQFSIVYETDDSFIGRGINGISWQKITKENFYRENYRAIIAYPYA